MQRVEKNVVMPANAKVFAQRKYPFNTMAPGDSFGVVKEGIKNARSAAYTYGARHRMTFASRKVGEKYRIWRLR